MRIAREAVPRKYSPGVVVVKSDIPRFRDLIAAHSGQASDAQGERLSISVKCGQNFQPMASGELRVVRDRVRWGEKK
jgi:hypothetical protein